MNNRKFVVARPTYTTYIKYFLFFCRNLYGRFSFGTQICFNALLEIIECNHFCGGRGVLYSDWKWTSAMTRKQTCSREPGDKLFRLPEALPLSMFVDSKFDNILSKTASTCKRKKFWNYKEKCDSWNVPLSQGMGSSRESYKRRSRDGREG